MKYYDPSIGRPFLEFFSNQRISISECQRLAPEVILYSVGDVLPSGHVVEEAGDILVGYPMLLQKLTADNRLRLEKVAIFEVADMEKIRARKMQRYEAAKADLERFRDPAAVLTDPETFQPFTCAEKRAKYIQDCEAAVERLKNEIETIPE